MGMISFSGIKMHTEIEFCKVSDIELKQRIEREFLKNSISYYVIWEDLSFFYRLFSNGKRKNCTICINNMQKDVAEKIILDMKIPANQIEMVLKRIDRIYF